MVGKISGIGTAQERGEIWGLETMKSHPELLGLMNIIGGKGHNLMNSGGLKAESCDESLNVER